MHFPYLRSTILPLTVGCIAGAAVIVGLTAGYYSWQLFAVACAIGLVVGVPVGLWSVRRMRATRPLTRPESPTMDPDAAARAVNPHRPEPYPPAADQTRVEPAK
jgi:hypothetical protein